MVRPRRDGPVESLAPGRLLALLKDRRWHSREELLGVTNGKQTTLSQAMRYLEDRWGCVIERQALSDGGRRYRLVRGPRR